MRLSESCRGAVLFPCVALDVLAVLDNETCPFFSVSCQGSACVNAVVEDRCW